MPDLDPTTFSAFLKASGLTFISVSPTEVIARVGASTAVQERGQFAVGLSNSTDFIRSHTSGPLEVKAKAIHQGRSGQLWGCDLTRPDGKTVARGTVRLQNVEHLASDLPSQKPAV